MEQEQYRYLHDELLELRRIKDTLQLATYSAYGVILTIIYSIDNPSPFMYLIPYAILIPLATKNIGKRDSVIRIATYIQEVIENDNNNINWETDMNQLMFEDTCFRSYRRGLRKIQNSTYSVLGLLSLFLFSNSYFRLIGTFGFNFETIIGCLINASGIYAAIQMYQGMKEIKISRRDYINEWQRVRGLRQ